MSALHDNVSTTGMHSKHANATQSVCNPYTVSMQASHKSVEALENKPDLIQASPLPKLQNDSCPNSRGTDSPSTCEGEGGVSAKGRRGLKHKDDAKR